VFELNQEGVKKQRQTKSEAGR